MGKFKLLRKLPAFVGGVTLLVAFAAFPALAADLYVSPSGSDGNACSSASAACLTIQAAIDKAAAGDTVHVGQGAYPFAANRIVIDKPGLTLVGEHSPFDTSAVSGPGDYMQNVTQAADASVLQQATAPAAAGQTNGMIWVNNVPNVTISNLYIALDNSGALIEGIVATGAVDGLVVDNNYIRVSGGSLLAPPNAMGITVNVGHDGRHHTSVPASEPRVTEQSVTITDNVVQPTLDGITSSFANRAIAVWGGPASISGNRVASSHQGIWVHSANGTSGDELKIADNWLYGKLQLYVVAGNIKTLIDANHFTVPDVMQQYRAFIVDDSHGSTGSVWVMTATGANTTISNNEFQGFFGRYRAIWVQNRPDTVIKNNSFTPMAGAEDFTAILVANQPVWHWENVGNGNPPAPHAYDVTIQGNQFHASGASNGQGKAILFVDDNDHNGAASFNSAVVGGGSAADGNHFEADIPWYIALDDRSCDAVNQDSNDAGCNGSSAYPIGQGIAYSSYSNGVTQKRPFSWDVAAEGNYFGGLYMPAMGAADFQAVQARTWDNATASANPNAANPAALGDVVYGWTPSAFSMAVDPDAGNDHKAGADQLFAVSGSNNGSPADVTGRIVITRNDGGSITLPGDGSTSADALQVRTGAGLVSLTRSGNGLSVSGVWLGPGESVAGGAPLPSTTLRMLLRVPGSYHVVVDLQDANNSATVYASEAFDYSVTQDLTVTFTGANPVVYNGGPQPLSWSVSPTSNPAVADLAAKLSLTYDGSASVPVNAGSYRAVVASSDSDYVVVGGDTHYVIDKAMATVTLGNLTQAYDGIAKSVSVTTVPASLAYSVTYTPGPGAPTQVGNYAVSATVTGLNYQGSASATMHIVSPLDGVTVSVTDYRDYAQYGADLSYLIVLENTSSHDAGAVHVDDLLPAGLVANGWRCIVGMSHCVVGSGTGDVHAIAVLDAGAGVAIRVKTHIPSNAALPDELLANKATASAQGFDKDDTDFTQVVIFRNGFEAGGDGAQFSQSLAAHGATASLSGANSHLLDLADVRTSAEGFVEVARLHAGNGASVQVRALHALGRVWLQLVGNDQTSDWSLVPDGTNQVVVGVARSGQHAVLLLVGASQDLQLLLPEGTKQLQLIGPSTGR